MLDSADWLLPGFLERSWPLLGFSLGLLWGFFGAPSEILSGILAAFWDGVWRITGAFTTLGRRLKWSWRSLQDSFPGIRHELIINFKKHRKKSIDGATCHRISKRAAAILHSGSSPSGFFPEGSVLKLVGCANPILEIYANSIGEKCQNILHLFMQMRQHLRSCKIPQSGRIL